MHAQTEGFDEGMEKLQILIDQINTHEETSVLCLSKDEIDLLYNLGYRLYENGKYQDCRQLFRFLTCCDPFDRRFWMGLGASYQLLKEYKIAQECYSVAALQDPKDPYVHLHAADCFFGLGEINQAISTLESAIETAKISGAKQLSAKLEQLHISWNKRL